MRGSDAVIVVVLGVFAVFVGTQVVSRKQVELQRAAREKQREAIAQIEGAQAAADRVTAARSAASPASAAPHTDVTRNTTQSATAAPTRNDDDIKARIANTPGTYMPAMLVDLGSQLIRWPDRREQGLRVWVQSVSTVHDFDLRYAQMARDAFADWGSGADGGGVPVRLDFVLDSATSDVRIVWIDRFPPDMGRRVGSTQRTNDQNGWIVSALIAVAVHDSLGRTIQPGDLAGIVRHEAGHALGLGHSNDPKTKMYPTELVNEIQPADRATLRLLYQLPPGIVR